MARLFSPSYNVKCLALEQKLTAENVATQARITKMFTQGFKGYETMMRYETAVFVQVF